MKAGGEQAANKTNVAEDSVRFKIYDKARRIPDIDDIDSQHRKDGPNSMIPLLLEGQHPPPCASIPTLPVAAVSLLRQTCDARVRQLKD